MNKKRVKIGEYKTVFSGIIFKIKQAKAVFPSGKLKTFEQAIRPISVTIMAIDNKGRLLLTREYRPKYKRYLWRLPAGRVEKNESPLKAAQRELREETGFKARKIKLFHFSDMGQSLDWKRYTYLATELKPAPLVGDEDEDITVMPTPIKKVFRMVLEGKIQSMDMAYLILKLYNQKYGLKKFIN